MSFKGRTPLHHRKIGISQVPSIGKYMLSKMISKNSTTIIIIKILTRDHVPNIPSLPIEEVAVLIHIDYYTLLLKNLPLLVAIFIWHRMILRLNISQHQQTITMMNTRNLLTHIRVFLWIPQVSTCLLEDLLKHTCRSHLKRNHECVHI